MSATCAAFALWAATSQAAVLDYDLHKEKAEAKAVEPGAGAATAKTSSPAVKEEKKTTADFKVIVGISPELLSVEQDGQRHVWNFKTYRIKHANPADKTYTETSLYSDLDFRIAELQNRMFLQKVMRKVERPDKKKLFDLFYSEAMFSLQLPDVAWQPEILESDQPGTKNFKYKDQIVTSFTPANHDLTPELLPQFRRFLLYRCNIHPLIRSKIEQAGKLPQSLSFYIDNPPLGWERSKYELKGFSDKAPADVPEDFKKVIEKNHPLKLVYEELEKRGGAFPANMKEDAIAFFDKAMSEQRYLDAFLALMEYSLATGRQLEPQLEQMSPHAKTDLDIQQFAKGFAKPTNEDEGKASLAALDSFDRSKLQKGYLLDYFRANLLTTLKHYDVTDFKTSGEANPEACFLKVLAVNPFIVEVYHDLGLWYQERYHAVHAWDSWDLGTSLCPDHPTMTKIAMQAKFMRDNFPDFFSSKEEMEGLVEVIK